MTWDPASPAAKPKPLRTVESFHHVPAVSIAPIEGGVFLALPRDAAYPGHIPTKEETRVAAVEARPAGSLVHFDPRRNVTTVVARGLLWPTGLAVPFGEDLALVLEPLAYRIRQVTPNPPRPMPVKPAA